MDRTVREGPPEETQLYLGRPSRSPAAERPLSDVSDHCGRTQPRTCVAPGGYSRAVLLPPLCPEIGLSPSLSLRCHPQPTHPFLSTFNCSRLPTLMKVKEHRKIVSLYSRQPTFLVSSAFELLERITCGPPLQ